MEIFQIAAFALVSVVLISLLREYTPSYGLLCLLVCSVGILLYILSLADPILEWLTTYSKYINQESLFIVLKAAGIAIVAQTAQDLCKDAGMHALATKVEFAARCLILVCALPLFQIILESLVDFL